MIGVVFPGQGSQKPGMGRELYEARHEARNVFGQIATATGIDIASLCFDSDDETLRQTQNAQMALFAVSLAAWSCLRAELGDSFEIGGMAGHSVGEYAALACAGVVSIETGARLVQRRGQVMAEAGSEQPGTMAAVLGMERDVLEQVCSDAGGVVVVANDNCPGQLVISGEIEAVRRAGELAQKRGAKRVLPLNVSGAFHSPLMEAPSRRFADSLDSDDFGTGRVPVYANVSAEPALDAERWPRLLEEQLRSPVRWTETVRAMRRDGIETFVECGPGEVLSGLIRRTDKEAQTFNVGDVGSLARTGEALRS